MSGYAPYLNISGLILDVIGFWLIASHLLRHSDTWLYLGGGDLTLGKNRWGFCLVISGFVLQGIAQTLSIF